MSNGARILWVDDEIDLLKPHILFLKGKGYDVETANNAYDAIDLVASHPFDLIILDEMMPGMTGLETLPKIKEIRPTTPVIMVTKSEEENIMDKAVGSKIADYLIKPVNPNQVLLSIKKNVHSQQLVTEQSTADYRSQFGEIASALGQARTFADWTAIYKRLVGGEVELTESTDPGIREILAFQKNEANNEFSKFVRNHYLDWFSSRDGDTPVLSHNLMKAKVFPVADENPKTIFILIDNFRYDQWRMIHPVLHSIYEVEQEDFYCSILPTATQYARNAIFAGLTPLAIDKIMPNLWLNDNEAGGKNRHEEDFLKRQMQSQGRSGQLYFACAHRDADYPRPGRRRSGIPLAYPFVVRTFRPAVVAQTARRARPHGDPLVRSRHDPRRQSGEGGRRSGDFAEPALQNREKPGLQSQGGIRYYEAGTGSPAQIQYHVDLYLRLQP